MSLLSWKVNTSGGVIAPDERLSWPRTIGTGLQHIAAMFGATFLVPTITGFPASTTLFFSGVGTILFLLITRNKLPSYLGSSFAFLAPIGAAMTSDKEHGMANALGGLIVTGVLLAIVGFVVKAIGLSWIDKMMPPVVTGTIVMVIGFNLAHVANDNFNAGRKAALITIGAIALFAVLFKGFIARISIVLGLVVGYLAAWGMGNIDQKHRDAITAAKWFGSPEFHSPAFKTSAIILFIPVVLVLIAENVGHVKAVAAMTGRNLDDVVGDALVADGVATVLAGAGGGSGTTTYAENIGTMAATKVYSTAAYLVAAIGAIVLSLSPKLGAVLAATPSGVLGGAGIVLYGMIGVLGARIWIESKVDFGNPINLFIASTAVIVGIINLTWKSGNYVFEGIINATVLTLVGYHLLTWISKMAGTNK